MRLVDADELRQVAQYEDITLDYLDSAPTVDAVEVVRCKDCKHYIPSKKMPHEGWCDDALQDVFKEDFYCGFGKRREP